MEFCSFSNHIVDSTISQISNLKQQNGNFAYPEVCIFVVIWQYYIIIWRTLLEYHGEIHAVIVMVQGHSRTSRRLRKCKLSASSVLGACESYCFHFELCFLV